MKTQTRTRMAMGLIFLMSLILFGCTQYSAASKMDNATEGSISEMTEQNMGNTMDTMEEETMKSHRGEMSGQKMEGSMDTMKGDTTKNTMDDATDKMMNDSSKEMMK